MELELMKPVYDELPYFQPNQVLTFEHLNELADFLSQQEHYTRNKLIGMGIVDGLGFNWTPNGSNAIVSIRPGSAITSAGYIIVYEGADLGYKREFSRLSQYPPFNSVAGQLTRPVYELITLEVYNDDTESTTKSQLLNTDSQRSVLILFLEPEIKTPAQCLDDGCDDKGKVFLYTIRPLLVPLEAINALLDWINSSASLNLAVEPGTGWRGTNSRINDDNLKFAQPRKLFNGELTGLNSALGLEGVFKKAIIDTITDTVVLSSRIDALLLGFPWIFQDTLAALWTEFGFTTTSPSLGNLFQTKASSIPVDANVQYGYDYVRDVIDGYNELLYHTQNLLSACGGNELQNPFHVMLGKTSETDDSVPDYRENKYILSANLTAQNFRFRHTFTPSSVAGNQYLLFEKVQQLARRLARLINYFQVPLNQTSLAANIKVTPSNDYDRLIGERAIPYYYSNADKIQSVWNYESTYRNSTSKHTGYRFAEQAELLKYDIAKKDFYRIEGQVGVDKDAALKAINGLKSSFNLPFDVIAVDVADAKPGEDESLSCVFADLEGEYAYYRDRKRNYLIELTSWAKKLNNYILLFNVKYGTNKIKQNTFLDIINKMIHLLESRCIEKFDYNAYKNCFAQIYYDVLLAYNAVITSSTAYTATQQINALWNILDMIFLRPIYKIEYLYLVRKKTSVSGQGVRSLTDLVNQTPGVEHLAGVRRGETFVLVYDSTLGNNDVIADLNVAGIGGGSCCGSLPCDEKPKAFVQPIAKPITMVIDKRSLKSTSTGYATPVKANTWEMSLSGTGFYLGDSQVSGVVIKAVGLIKNEEVTNKFQAEFLTNPHPIPRSIQLQGHYGHLNGIDQLKLTCYVNPDYASSGPFWFTYTLEGNFPAVSGHIVLYILRDTQIYTIPMGSQSADIPVGDSKDTGASVSFGEPSRKKTLKPIYKSKLGNNVMLTQNPDGNSYAKVVKTGDRGIDKVQVSVESQGSITNSYMILNIVDHEDKTNIAEYRGTVLQANGKPAAGATVIVGSNQFPVDSNGQFIAYHIKNGDVMQIQMKGSTTEVVQVNSQLPTTFKLKTDPTTALLNKIKVPTTARKLFDTETYSQLTNLL